MTQLYLRLPRRHPSIEAAVTAAAAMSAPAQAISSEGDSTAAGARIDSFVYARCAALESVIASTCSRAAAASAGHDAAKASVEEGDSAAVDAAVAEIKGVLNLA